MKIKDVLFSLCIYSAVIMWIFGELVFLVSLFKEVSPSLTLLVYLVRFANIGAVMLTVLFHLDKKFKFTERCGWR